MSERLQRVLAAAGLGSRRACEALIREGRVTVDGTLASLGMSVDPAAQTVLVDGAPILLEALEYWLLNKQVGVMTTAHDPQGRPTVVDCVPTAARVYPVGRLDVTTSGVLLLTNDGPLAHRLMHPRYGVEKEYEARVKGVVTRRTVEALRKGIVLDDGPTAPARVSVSRTGEWTVVRLTIHEGRNRQVRRMLEALGHPVLALHRKRFGSVTDRGLPRGAARRLEPAEVETLKRLVFPT